MGSLHVLEGTMKAESCIKVLEQHMLPSRWRLFQQDKAKPHTAAITTARLCSRRFRLLNWPACSFYIFAVYLLICLILEIVVPIFFYFNKGMSQKVFWGFIFLQEKVNSHTDWLKRVTKRDTLTQHLYPNHSSISSNHTACSKKVSI